MLWSCWRMKLKLSQWALILLWSHRIMVMLVGEHFLNSFSQRRSGEDQLSEQDCHQHQDKLAVKLTATASKPRTEIPHLSSTYSSPSHQYFLDICSSCLLLFSFTTPAAASWFRVVILSRQDCLEQNAGSVCLLSVAFLTTQTCGKVW